MTTLFIQVYFTIRVRVQKRVGSFRQLRLAHLSQGQLPVSQLLRRDHGSRTGRELGHSKPIDVAMRSGFVRLATFDSLMSSINLVRTIVQAAASWFGGMQARQRHVVGIRVKAHAANDLSSSISSGLRLTPDWGTPCGGSCPLACQVRTPCSSCSRHLGVCSRPRATR